MPPPNPAPRQVRLFRHNRSQVIRVPVEFELPGSWEPLDEEFPEIDDPPPAPKDIF